MKIECTIHIPTCKKFKRCKLCKSSQILPYTHSSDYPAVPHVSVPKNNERHCGGICVLCCIFSCMMIPIAGLFIGTITQIIYIINRDMYSASPTMVPTMIPTMIPTINTTSTYFDYSQILT